MSPRKKEKKPNPRPKINYPPVPTRKWTPPKNRAKKKPKPIDYPPVPTRKWTPPKMRAKKKPKPIDYPPVTTRRWIPPDKRAKKKRKPGYVKPPGISQQLQISTLGRVWHNFHVIGHRTLLLGSFSETHKRFRPKTNGYQSPCNCAIAIAFSTLYKMSKWNTPIIDKVLEMGDLLYLSSLQHLGEKCKTTLQLQEVYTSFFFENTKIIMSTKEEPYQGKIFEDYEDSPFLANVIDDFFNDDHVSGILTAQKKFWAFWKTGSAYFLFDPTEHDEKARPWRGVPGRGVSFVMRFHTTEALVDVIHENVSKRVNADFEMTPCSVLKMVKLNTVPPELNVNTHCPDVIPKEEIFVPVPPPSEIPEVEEEEERILEVVDIEEEAEVFDAAGEADEYSPDVGKGDQEKPKEVSKSMIPVERAKAESITYFGNVVPFKVGILRASTFQGDTRFSSFRGKQSLANAMAALTMLRLYKSKNWFRKILDETLLLGEEIHKDSVQSLPSDKILKVSTMCKRIELEERQFTPDVEEYTTVGKLQSPDADVLDLLPALQEFFRNNDTCIITGPLILAVWKEDGLYYMFDPNERDHNGLVIMKTLQVGSELQVLQYTPGVACVTWFSNLKDLAEIYLNNVDRPKRRDLFILSRVQINDYIRAPDPWNHFQGVARGKWILRGTFNQNDRRFDAESRNTQCTATASLALAYSRLKHVKQWTTEDVDEVLLQGDTLYKSSVQYLKDCNKFVDKQLMVDEVQRKFPLEGKEIQLDIQDCLVNGLLDAKDDNDALNLKKGMRQFFEENETGVLTARSISVAIWKNEEVYYYYDSHSRDDAGIVNNFGTACLLRILNLEDLASAVEANLGAGSNPTFNISRVGIKIWEMSEDGVVRPPLNNYQEIDNSSAILNSLLSERSLDFKLNRGKQTIPMCFAAAAMMKLYPAAIWTIDILNEVLLIGDKHYTATMVKRETTPNLPEELDIDEVYAENCLMQFNIGVNKFSISYGPIIAGNFEDDFQKAMGLFLNEITENEMNQKELLIASDVYTVITWIENGVYYLFDPKPRDAYGQVFGKEEWSIKMEEEYGEDEGEDDMQIARTAMAGGGDSPDDPAAGDDASETKKRSIGSQASEGADDSKHRPQYWRAIEDEQGKACTMWFTTGDKLIQHILENTPPTKRSDIQFKLFPVNVNNKPDVKNVFDAENAGEREDNYAGDWYLFKEIDHGRWILRATIDFTNAMFPAHNRGRQTVAMCYSAMAFAKRFALSKFKPMTVNDILKYGDRLHSATRHIRYKEIKKNKELALSELEIEDVLNRDKYGIENLARAFCIGLDQMRANITPDFMRGDIHAQDSEGVLDVKQAFKAYFQENRFGLLECKGLTVAVWRGAKVYFMFDPSSRGPSGVKCVNGEACITRYLDHDVMADVFLQNVEKEGNNGFIIHKVRIRIVPCPREPKPEEKERPEERPRFGGYVMVMPGKNILRGTLSQDDPKFGRGKNVQCAPIAIAALTMTLLHKASIWTRPFVDEILILGDELYVATLDTLGFEFNPWEQGLTIRLVNKDYKMGVLRANCELRNMDQRGIIEIKHPKVLNLRQGIEKFFEENTHGVIETETLTVAIWEEEDQPDLIYMFDPNPRGPAGLPFIGGTACVLTFETAKMAADHFVCNVTDKSKRTGEFVITPVEIVVGTARTKPKAKQDPCSAKNQAKIPKACSPTDCEKKRLRKLAAEERARKEALRQAKIGRFEYHVLSSGDAILRGSKSQTWKNYSATSQGRQDIANCFSAFVLHRLMPLTNWHYKHIDLILDVGDQLFQDSYITYAPTENPKLGFKNVLRKVFIKEVQVSLKVYKPVLTNTLTAFNLEIALLNYFQQEPFGVLSANNEHVGLFFKQGFYYMFDPHDRDLEGIKCSSGCACVMKFQTIPSLVARFIENTVTIYDSVKNFTVTLITIGSITKRGIPEPLG